MFIYSRIFLCFHLFLTEGNPDTLICGNCREYFADLSELLEHKRSYCKLRFTCKCQENVQSEFISTYLKYICIAGNNRGYAKM